MATLAKFKPLAVSLAIAGALTLSSAATGAARHQHAPAAVRERAVAANASGVALSQIHVLGDRPAPFALDAKGAILIDMQSGAVLYAYHEHQRIQPASLAKIMTFYLALEALERGAITLDTPVTVSEAAWRLSMDNSVSRMFLDVGSRVPIRDLLYGLMVSSGNDAAVALAEEIAGSSDAFVKMMNDKCRELRLEETRFASPDGLPEPDQYTTAADMVTLARDLVQRFPQALSYTSTKEFTYHKIKQPNFNTLLFYDSRVDGLKTGHVAEAGYHLVATARSDGTELVSALMGAPSSEKRRLETEKLLAWAFRSFVTVTPDWRRSIPDALRVYEGSAERVAIAPAGQTCLTVERGEQDKLSLAPVMKTKYLVAPIGKGQRVGELSVLIAGKPRASVPIETQTAVAKGGFFHRIADRARLLL